MQNLRNDYSKRLHLLSITSYTCTLILNFALQTNGLMYNYNESNHDRISKYGWMSPSHEINQTVGEPLEIFCTIDSDYNEAKGFTSENLFFEDEEEIMVDHQNVTIVNATTISMYLSDEEESTYFYACFLTINKTRDWVPRSPKNVSRGNISSDFETKYVSAISNGSYEYDILIGFVVVSFQILPKEVENFRCILVHLATLKCYWDKPENTAETNYTIQFVPINSTVSDKIALCPTDDDQVNNECTWSSLTDPPYLNIYENLDITIKGTNECCEIKQSFIFNKYENIKPDGILRLYAVRVMPTSIKLCWQIGDLENYPNDWIYEIEFKNQDDSRWSNLICNSENVTQDEDNICYNVTGLEAYTNYDYNIRMRSSLAPTHSDYWSPSYTAIFYTKPLLPTDVPETDRSLFRTYSEKLEPYERNVSIYWKPTNFSTQYGASFHYEIKVFQVGEDASNKQISKMRPIFENYFEAKYKLGPSAYQFEIRSANSEGSTKRAAIMNVPAAKDVVNTNLLYYYITYLNRTSDYIWHLPTENTNIVSYTLFQVSFLEDAQGKVVIDDLRTHVIHFPANVTRYRLVRDWLPKIGNKQTLITRTYISANTNKSTTGLIPRAFRIYSVSDYWKGEQFGQKVEKWKKLSKGGKIQEVFEQSATAVHTGWKFSEEQHHKWLMKLAGN